MKITSTNLRSTRTYNFLRNTLNMKLPSKTKSSLNNWSTIVNGLKKFARTLDSNSKICSIMFDQSL